LIGSAASGNGLVCVGEEDEYAWLAETEPSNLYMNSGVYAGPSIKI
jgi:cysteamine dioxygenase